MPKELDKETKKVFDTGEKLKSMTESSGWAVAREMLIRRVAAKLNMADIGTNSIDPSNIVQIIGIRQGVALELMQWLKEVEGTVEQHKANAGSFEGVKDEFIINVEDLKT